MKRFGIGTYRMVLGNKVHEECLWSGLNSGVFSVVDTAPNYNDGLSERLIGDVWARLGDDKKRGVQVVSKFGYIQGETLQLHQEKPFPGAVEYTDDCAHCIHPKFMEEQLDRSLKRMGMEKLSTYLIHNPEHFLMSKLPPDVGESAGDLKKMYEKELFDQLYETFVALEQQVSAGRIGSYGVSSNSFALPLEHPHFVSFEELVRLASSAAEAVGSGQHSLRTFQFPGNLIERTALTPIAAGGNGCAQFAKENGIETMVNRALTAFDEVGSWRLAELDFPIEYATLRDDLIAHLSPEPISNLDELSKEEREVWLETLEACQWLKQLINDLDAQLGVFSSVMHYQDDLQRKIVPMINAKLDGMDTDTSDMLFGFFHAYEKAVRSVAGSQTRNHVVEHITNDSNLKRYLESGKQEQDKNVFVPPRIPIALDLGTGQKPLEQCALDWLYEHPAVSTILLGAIQPQYVEQIKRIYFTV